MRIEPFDIVAVFMTGTMFVILCCAGAVVAVRAYQVFNPPAPDVDFAAMAQDIAEIKAAVIDAVPSADSHPWENPGMDDLWEFMTPDWYASDWEATDKTKHPERYISQPCDPANPAGEPGIDDGIY